jgi:hypothetical protein
MLHSSSILLYCLLGWTIFDISLLFFNLKKVNGTINLSCLVLLKASLNQHTERSVVIISTRVVYLSSEAETLSVDSIFKWLQEKPFPPT